MALLVISIRGISKKEINNAGYHMATAVGDLMDNRRCFALPIGLRGGAYDLKMLFWDLFETSSWNAFLYA